MKEIIKLSKQTVTYGFGKGIAKFFGLFLMPIYTRVLTPSDYGILSILGVSVFLLSTIFTGGLDSASGRYFFKVEEKKQKGSILFTSFIMRSLSFIFILALFLAVPYFSSLLFQNKVNNLIVYITLILVPFGMLCGEQTQHFRYYFETWKYNLLIILRLSVNLACGVLFVLILRKGILGAQAALLASMLAFLVLSFPFHIKNYYPKFNFDWAKIMLKYGIPLVPAGLAVWILSFADRFFLLHYSGTHDIGLYSIAIKLSSVLGLLAMATQMSYGPFALSIYKKPNARTVFSQSWRLFIVVGCSVSFLLSLFGKELVQILTPAEYHYGVIALPFLAFSIVIMQSVQFTGLGLSLAEKTKPFAYGAGIAALTNVGLNFLFIPRWSFLGAAFTTLVANIVYLAIVYLNAQRSYHIDYRIKNIISYVIVMIGISMLIPNLEFNRGATFYIWQKLLLLCIPIIMPFLSGVVRYQSVFGILTKHGFNIKEYLTNGS